MQALPKLSCKYRNTERNMINAKTVLVEYRNWNSDDFLLTCAGAVGLDKIRFSVFDGKVWPDCLKMETHLTV